MSGPPEKPHGHGGVPSAQAENCWSRLNPAPPPGARGAAFASSNLPATTPVHRFMLQNSHDPSTMMLLQQWLNTASLAEASSLQLNQQQTMSQAPNTSSLAHSLQRQSGLLDSFQPRQQKQDEEEANFNEDHGCTPRVDVVLLQQEQFPSRQEEEENKKKLQRRNEETTLEMINSQGEAGIRNPSRRVAASGAGKNEKIKRSEGKEPLSAVAAASCSSAVKKIPCKARGMPPDHNPMRAYFEIPADAEHGRKLTCSFPACRNAGIKFLYCIYCKVPAARRSFRQMHGHLDKIEDPVIPGSIPSGATSRHYDKAGGQQGLKKDNDEVKKSRMLATTTNSSTRAPSSASSRPPPLEAAGLHRQDEERWGRHQELLLLHQNKQRKPKQKDREEATDEEQSSYNSSSSSSSIRERKRAWRALFYSRPKNDDHNSLEKWMLQVLHVTGSSTGEERTGGATRLHEDSTRKKDNHSRRSPPLDDTSSHGVRSTRSGGGGGATTPSFCDSSSSSTTSTSSQEQEVNRETSRSSSSGDHHGESSSPYTTRTSSTGGSESDTSRSTASEQSSFSPGGTTTNYDRDVLSGSVSRSQSEQQGGPPHFVTSDSRESSENGKHEEGSDTSAAGDGRRANNFFSRGEVGEVLSSGNASPTTGDHGSDSSADEDHTPATNAGGSSSTQVPLLVQQENKVYSSCLQKEPRSCVVAQHGEKAREKRPRIDQDEQTHQTTRRQGKKQRRVVSNKTSTL